MKAKGQIPEGRTATFHVYVPFASRDSKKVANMRGRCLKNGFNHGAVKIKIYKPHYGKKFNMFFMSVLCTWIDTFVLP
jgi:hypothetical protein